MHFKLADSSSGSVTVQVPQTPIGSVGANEPNTTLSLYVAQRLDPQTVEVVFAVDIKNGESLGTSSQSMAADLSWNGDGQGTVSGVSLFDSSSMKEYETYMVDPSKDGTCLCSDDSLFDAASGTYYYTALIAAPPANDNEVSFVTGIGTIAGVTLTGS